MSNITEKSLKTLRAMMRQAKINSESNTDEQALEVKSLYPNWEEIEEGAEIKEGKRVNYLNVLYNVIATHNKQSTWNPQDASTLFTPINEEHEGTIDDPVPWVSGMIAEEGLYYIDEGIKYLCIESSGIGLYGQPKDLSRYFETVE